jgi:hypothetical protein
MAKVAPEQVAKIMATAAKERDRLLREDQRNTPLSGSGN